MVFVEHAHDLKHGPGPSQVRSGEWLRCGAVGGVLCSAGLRGGRAAELFVCIE